MVWSPELGRPTDVTYDSTCFASSGIRCEVDAAPETRAAHRRWLDRERAVYQAFAAVEELEQPRKGQRVIVARGRKVPIGTTGSISWIGDGYRRGTTRLGITTDAGDRVYTDAANVDPFIGGTVTGLAILAASIRGAAWLALCAQQLDHKGRGSDGWEVFRAADVELHRARRGLWARVAVNAAAAASAEIVSRWAIEAEQALQAERDLASLDNAGGRYLTAADQD